MTRVKDLPQIGASAASESQALELQRQREVEQEAGTFPPSRGTSADKPLFARRSAGNIAQNGCWQPLQQGPTSTWI